MLPSDCPANRGESPSRAPRGICCVGGPLMVRQPDSSPSSDQENQFGTPIMTPDRFVDHVADAMMLPSKLRGGSSRTRTSESREIPQSRKG